MYFRRSRCICVWWWWWWGGVMMVVEVVYIYINERGKVVDIYCSLLLNIVPT
jgi:hypothetical protein